MFRHNEATKQRIKERLIAAHRRLRDERGGYLTPEGRATMVASRTPDWRRQHAERQKDTLHQAHRAAVTAADRFARRFLPILLRLQKQGLNLRAMAAEMNLCGYPTRCGSLWTDQTVRQMLRRRHNLLKPEMLSEPPRRFIGWGRK